VTLQNLLVDLDQAIAGSTCCEQAVEGTCAVLRHYSAHQLELPARLRQTTSSGCYARHLVHHKDGNGFCVVAMVWSPGQGTSVHDHDGTWCVEGCLEGKLDVTSFRVVDQTAPDHIRMVPESVVSIGEGAVGSLIPPFEHHKIHNSYSEPAVTIHVYGKELSQCTRYQQENEDWFRAEKVDLSYTTVP
jgi:predicted metal-dependent enzyme (double-stranded beta helix superfamily)